MTLDLKQAATLPLAPSGEAAAAPVFSHVTLVPFAGAPTVEYTCGAMRICVATTPLLCTAPESPLMASFGLTVVYEDGDGSDAAVQRAGAACHALLDMLNLYAGDQEYGEANPETTVRLRIGEPEQEHGVLVSTGVFEITLAERVIAQASKMIMLQAKAIGLLAEAGAKTRRPDQACH